MHCAYGSGSCGPTITTVAHHVVTTVAPHVGGSLPFTGGDVVGLVLLGVGALAGGFALLRSSRHSVES